METSNDLYSRIISNGPSPGTLLLVLSKLKEEGRLKRVIQECLKALNVYENDMHLRQLLVDAYFEDGQISQAESEMEKVTSQIGELISVYKLKAEIYRRQRREEEAIEALKLYLAHRPDDEEALHLFNTLKPEETPAPEPQPAVEAAPATSEGEGIPEIATSTLAEIYFDQGQIHEAIKTYEKIVEQNPGERLFNQRLEGLRSLVAEEKTIEDKGADRDREKKKKMIAILDAWLANIRQQSKGPLSV